MYLLSYIVSQELGHGGDGAIPLSKIDLYCFQQIRRFVFIKAELAISDWLIAASGYCVVDLGL